MRTYDMRGFKLRFADLECVLLRLGFKPTHTNPDRMLYTHTTEPNTYIILRLHTPDAQVRPGDYVSARRLIDERGLLDERDFDRMIAEVASASEEDYSLGELQPLGLVR